MAAARRDRRHTGNVCSGNACSGNACSGNACSGNVCSGNVCSGDGLGGRRIVVSVRAGVSLLGLILCRVTA